jgi:hypothetical protein
VRLRGLWLHSRSLVLQAWEGKKMINMPPHGTGDLVVQPIEDPRVHQEDGNGHGKNSEPT